MAYEFIHKNLPQAMPSVRTIQSTIHSQYTHIEEGDFRFDQLSLHLEKHHLPRIVTISEDGTRIIKRVEYDPRTNRCVGFVLPSQTNGNGEIENNQFEATSFENIEDMFKSSTIARYAYTYIAQPLLEGAPSFCLCCFGTDNKFTSDHILMWWKFILRELQNRNITVVNMASDGDSRLLKAMLTVLDLTSKNSEKKSKKSENKSDKISGIKSDCEVHINDKCDKDLLPTEFHPWVKTKRFPSVLCVQDIVHIGVICSI